MATKSAAVLYTLFAASVAGVPLSARAQATSPACKPVLDAHTKEIGTPHHGYQTDTSPANPGKQRTSEIISTPTASYVLLDGKWTRVAITTQQNLAQMQENLRNAKVYQCRQLPDESVDGAAASVYTAHAENEFVKNDVKLWVTKSSGLIAREEIDMYSDDAGGKRHISTRYDYRNVQPPAGVK